MPLDKCKRNTMFALKTIQQLCWVFCGQTPLFMEFGVGAEARTDDLCIQLGMGVVSNGQISSGCRVLQPSGPRRRLKHKQGRVPASLLGHCALINLHRSWLLKCAVIDKAPWMIDLFTAHASDFHNITSPITSHRRHKSHYQLALCTIIDIGSLKKVYVELGQMAPFLLKMIQYRSDISRYRFLML